MNKNDDAEVEPGADFTGTMTQHDAIRTHAALLADHIAKAMAKPPPVVKEYLFQFSVAGTPYVMEHPEPRGIIVWNYGTEDLKLYRGDGGTGFRLAAIKAGNAYTMPLAGGTRTFSLVADAANAGDAVYVQVTSETVGPGKFTL